MRMRHILSVVYSILHPILKHVLSILFSNNLFSHISSASDSQTFSLHPNFTHSLYSQFSKFPSAFYSQSSPKNLNLKHQFSIPISNNSSVYHSKKPPTIIHSNIYPFSNIHPLFYPQTSPPCIILKHPSVPYSQTHTLYPIPKHHLTTPISNISVPSVHIIPSVCRSPILTIYKPITITNNYIYKV